MIIKTVGCEWPIIFFGCTSKKIAMHLHPLPLIEATIIIVTFSCSETGYMSVLMIHRYTALRTILGVVLRYLLQLEIIAQ